jgi:hypothetical protein
VALDNDDKFKYLYRKIIAQPSLAGRKRNADYPLTRSPVLSGVSSENEIHLLLATFKNQSLLTLNLRGESHEKGLPEDANMRASEGILYPFEALFRPLSRLFPNIPEKQKRKEGWKMIKRIIKSFIVVYMLFCGSTYAEEVPFMEHLISENFKAPDFSYPADIDEDGDIDVAVVSRIGGKIAWFDNNGGSPPIFTERIVGYSNDARGVFVTDVDGDGEPDILTTSALGGREVIWWESDGAVPPNFSKHTIPVNGYDWFPVFATDLDDDGDIDVLSASMWDDKIAWYENDGGSPPEFFQRVISTNVDQASHVTAADVDGDGDIDVLSGSNRSDYKIAWFENGGNLPPSFTEQIITNTAGHPLFTFPTDVDDDGDTDVLATDMYADKLVWYDNNGELMPTFTERIIASLVCPPPFTLCFAPRNIYGGYDIDGDGDSDVLALTTMNKPVEDPGGKLMWYENISIAKLLYTPIAPCRIADTRKRSPGMINTNTERNFHAHGSGTTIGDQGGNAAGCSAPFGEPLAAHINMIAVNPTGKGNLQAFPVGAGTGAGLSVNYNTIDTNLANAGTVKTVTGSGPDITVASNFSSAHTVIDVLGYYYPAP